MDERLISVDLRAQFGFLKKPDTNEGIYLTYNCLHKPALLGILGAIVGLGGYAQAYSVKKDLFPDYYQKLKHLKIGIQPLDSAKGNFQKTVITYNNSVGYANLDGGTLIVSEQTLLTPAYRVFLLLSVEEILEVQLYGNLKTGESEYIPYLGKNDFQLWWENFTEYEFEANHFPKESYQVETIFVKRKDRSIRDSRVILPIFDFSQQQPDNFIYLEELPFEFDEKIKHYSKKSFAFSNWKVVKEYALDNLFLLKSEQKIIQLV
ncbi:MAG: type I-B CRISPR-associated protein Cas5b [Bacteroidetes bacterium]|nr:type I-B CRISPR-associated protein Cas5b [Bacteroidota bacterium]